MEEEPGATPPRRRRGRRAPRGTENVSGREYIGCGLWIAAFLVLVVVSFTVGLRLRPDGGPVTLAEGTQGSGAYRLEGDRDEADDPCLTLFRPGPDGDDVEVTGQCGFTASDGDEPGSGRFVVTSADLPDGTTVVFAPVPETAEEVRLHLSDGSEPTVEVRRSDDADVSWFLHETDQDVDGPADLLDGAGDPIDPP